MFVFFTDAAGNDHLDARSLQLSVAGLAMLSVFALAAAFFIAIASSSHITLSRRLSSNEELL